MGSFGDVMHVIWWIIKFPFWLIFMVFAILGMVIGFVLGVITLPLRCCQENIIINNKFFGMVMWPKRVHKFFYGGSPNQQQQQQQQMSEVSTTSGGSKGDKVPLTA